MNFSFWFSIGVDIAMCAIYFADALKRRKNAESSCDSIHQIIVDGIRAPFILEFHFQMYEHNIKSIKTAFKNMTVFLLFKSAFYIVFWGILPAYMH